MKKIRLLAYAILTSFSILSCTDAYEIIQDGELTEEVALQTTKDLRAFLNGNVYGALNTQNEIWLTSVLTDETGIAPGNSGWYFAEHRYILTPDNGYVAGIWGSHYRLINRVNRLLKAAEGITPAAGLETQRFNSVLAEARAMRALAYLQLQSYFTTDMADDSALGVMLLTDVPELMVQLPRVSNAQIYALMEEDLNFADANLKTDDLQNPLTYKFVTKGMIHATMARMYAYREMYSLAKQHAQWVVSNGPALTPAASYATIWSDAAQGEVIFARSHPSTEGTGGIAGFWTTNTTDINGSPFLKMGMNLYNQYTPVPNWGDIRKTVFADGSSQPNVIIINKYPGKGNTPLRNDVKVFRTSEMYFILAEAAVAEGDLATAATMVRSVRLARKIASNTTSVPVSTYATPVDAWRDILKERRLELSFEGHRYVDLRRLGAVAGVSIDRSPLDDGGAFLNAPLTLPITDYRWTLPIPAAEKLGNPGIVQNPGYN
ncbi:RagB/SusD family nutrient uptake outer membrane protein [Chryseobacterium sp. cx-311]|uniref:RagB/SusD family nutrient uptake outer membrane protein n=1 Tax=Marnyiella aurantia TaxID=2758037 RepID=UPI001AE7833D|nr:RagB/SusD family nutrient uptake outer membrane protein [Marnyiella aurantia]MBP0612078.1 RagB/SusD family nutrient uptake outer membrane protein [Marnyiella aurantia]